MIEPVRHTVVVALLALGSMPAVTAIPTTTLSTRSAIDESAPEWSELAPNEHTPFFQRLWKCPSQSC